jgi:hypothetical protein
LRRGAVADDDLADGMNRTHRVRIPPCTGANDCGRKRSPARRTCAAQCEVLERPQQRKRAGHESRPESALGAREESNGA